KRRLPEGRRLPRRAGRQLSIRRRWPGSHPNRPGRPSEHRIRRSHPPILMRRRIPLIVLLILVAAPASANTGTPLMWAGTFHLFIGNALIGIFEAAILVRFFRFRAARATPWMILANYFSMIAGAAFFRVYWPTV